jgi:hypothetical protein
MKANRIKFLIVFSLAICVFLVLQPAQAQTITWKGYTWHIQSGHNIAPGPNNWNTNNVFVDANGYLHLLINYNTTSGNWDCAEVYTTNKLGFGTYQWQIESQIDMLDPWIDLALFNYLGPDGSNEIDIEYAHWGITGNNNCWWTVYPNSGRFFVGQKSYNFSLSGTTTSRFTWSKNGVQYWHMGGFQPVGTTVNVINSWNFAPTNSSIKIPQNAMPLYMNLWLFQGHAPANGQPVEVIISDFEFVPLGSPQPAQLSQLTLLPGDGVRLSVQGAVNWHYQILSSSNLLDWLNIGTILATNNLFQFTDTNPVSLNPRFYRTLTEP